MGFLYPLMALGILAAGVPIWLHLRRRDEANVVEFSTLRFLDDQPLARTQPLWPQNWPLLLLRVAALLFLVAAFMWPYAENEDASVVQESLVYILDNTLSHQVNDGFLNGRDEIADELAKNDLRRQIGVVELSSTARVVVRFGDDPTASAEIVRGLMPSSERGSYVDAFRTAGEMLTTSLGAVRRIVLLSDGQANQWALGSDRPPSLKGIEVELPAIAEPSLPNLHLTEPRVRRVYRNGKYLVEASVELGCAGSFAPPTIVFRNKGDEVARQEVDLGDAELHQLHTVMTQWDCDPTEWVVGDAVIEVSSDPLPNDDRVVFSLPPLTPGRIELIAHSLYVQRALAPEVLRGRWEVRLIDAANPSGSDAASAHDVLCVESRALSSPSVRELVREDLGAGRGVILWVDPTDSLAAGFLREFGVELESSQHNSIAPSSFRYLFSDHPIFAPFRSTEFGDLSEIEFSNYRRLTVRDAVPLAYSALGDPLVFDVEKSFGRVLVFAFAFDRHDTNWPIHPTFIPFLDKCLEYVRGQTTMKTAYQPGESVVWQLSPGISAKTVALSRLDSEARTTSLGIPASIHAELRDGTAQFQLPGQEGQYSLCPDGNEPIAILDVNPSSLESDLTYDDEPASLAVWLNVEGHETPKMRPDGGSGIALTTLEALQQHIWWYLLIAAFAAFLAEIILSGRLAHAS